MNKILLTTILISSLGQGHYELTMYRNEPAMGLHDMVEGELLAIKTCEYNTNIIKEVFENTASHGALTIEFKCVK